MTIGLPGLFQVVVERCRRNKVLEWEQETTTRWKRTRFFPRKRKHLECIG